MKITKDPLTGVLYLRLRAGKIDDTLPWPGWEDSVYLDLDEEHNVLGVEFLSFEEMEGLLDENPNGLEIPERVIDSSKLRNLTKP
jgi:uncharacterized protein YuzE